MRVILKVMGILLCSVYSNTYETRNTAIPTDSSLFK